MHLNFSAILISCIKTPLISVETVVSGFLSYQYDVGLNLFFLPRPGDSDGVVHTPHLSRLARSTAFQRDSSVLVLGGDLGWQKNICADHAAFTGVVADLAVVFAVKFLPGAVGSGCGNRLPHAPHDLGDMEVKQGQLSALLLAG